VLGLWVAFMSPLDDDHHRPDHEQRGTGVHITCLLPGTTKNVNMVVSNPERNAGRLGAVGEFWGPIRQTKDPGLASGLIWPQIVLQHCGTPTQDARATLERAGRLGGTRCDIAAAVSRAAVCVQG